MLWEAEKDLENDQFKVSAGGWFPFNETSSYSLKVIKRIKN